MKKQQIKSLEHACEVLGITLNLEKFNDLGLPDADVKPLIAYYSITKIVEATNKLNNWKADWGNSNQYKYSPYYRVSRNADKPSGLGFSGSGYDGWTTDTFVGSRLCVGTSDEALYIAKQFEELFESAWLIIYPPESK